ncbi:hypothetical protein [Paraburkholderia saeva]|uniref:hypothetical protein n=1 Tax=Paraburkholderia saeva TaxID=2777537 RepID=UPI001E628FB5|nr:hypothetical protein [Paraburkholderia saeva]
MKIKILSEQSSIAHGRKPVIESLAATAAASIAPFNHSNSIRFMLDELNVPTDIFAAEAEQRHRTTHFVQISMARGMPQEAARRKVLS